MRVGDQDGDRVEDEARDAEVGLGGDVVGLLGGEVVLGLRGGHVDGSALVSCEMIWLLV